MLFLKFNWEFWHGYNWAQKKVGIKSNRDFWIPKIEQNIQRDAPNNSILSRQGFMVFRLWQHEVEKELDSCVGMILKPLVK
jgi:DNA mismatch endonuclease, patch repair protein